MAKEDIWFQKPLMIYIMPCSALLWEFWKKLCYFYLMKWTLLHKHKIIHVGKHIPKVMYKMFGSDLLISTQEQGLTVSADSSVFSSGQEMKHQII